MFNDSINQVRCVLFQLWKEKRGNLPDEYEEKLSKPLKNDNGNFIPKQFNLDNFMIDYDTEDTPREDGSASTPAAILAAAADDDRIVAFGFVADNVAPSTSEIVTESAEQLADDGDDEDDAPATDGGRLHVDVDEGLLVDVLDE